MQALTEPIPKVPAGQGVQLAAPARENVPLVQNSQTVAPGRFAGKEYMPAAQASHVVFLPRPVENVPGVQSSQSRSVVLEQALQPGNRLNLPAEHRMQGPPGGPHRPVQNKSQKAYCKHSRTSVLTWQARTVQPIPGQQGREGPLWAGSFQAPVAERGALAHHTRRVVDPLPA